MSDQEVRALRREHEQERTWASFVRWARAAARNGYRPGLEFVRVAPRFDALCTRDDRLRASIPATRDGSRTLRQDEFFARIDARVESLSRRMLRAFTTLELDGLAPNVFRPPVPFGLVHARATRNGRKQEHEARLLARKRKWTRERAQEEVTARSLDERDPWIVRIRPDQSIERVTVGDAHFTIERARGWYEPDQTTIAAFRERPEVFEVVRRSRALAEGL